MKTAGAVPGSRAAFVAATAVSGAAALLLSGCGFHLEGSYPLPRSLAVVHIDAVDTQSDFYFGLRKDLLAAGTHIDQSAQDKSVAVIHVLGDNIKDAILSVSTKNIPIEYELTYTVRFSVDAMGKQLIAPEERTQVRDYYYSESEQLAKQREQAVLTDAMAQELAAVVMRRLSSL
ncbi:MAG: LPS assembly lipoprotein LptE [Steroidobacteraceae bacterium]